MACVGVLLCAVRQWRRIFLSYFCIYLAINYTISIIQSIKVLSRPNLPRRLTLGMRLFPGMSRHILGPGLAHFREESAIVSFEGCEHAMRPHGHGLRCDRTTCTLV